jgi:hypothetical protein
MAEIIVNVPRGHDKPITTEVNGVPGSQCHALTAGLIEALGGNVLADEETDEVHQCPLADQNYLRESAG